MRRDAGERGAVLPMVAILSTAIVAFAALAVDLGVQRVGRRDMQALADVVALDLARQLDGRTASAISSDPAWNAGRAESVARNADTVGDAPAVSAELGKVDQATGVFTAATGSAVPTAVRVVAATAVDFAFTPGRGPVSRDAVAAVALTHGGGGGSTQLNAFACFRIGSFAVRLASSNSPLLNALIGDALNTGVLTYSGLATADVSFEALDAALGIGSPTEFARTEVTVSDLVVAMASVLEQEGGTQAELDVLQSIQANLSTAMQGTLIDLGRIVAVGVGNGSALDTRLNVLNLISGAAFVANGTNFLSVPGLTVSLPGVTNTTVSLKVIEGPQMGCGKPGQVGAGAETSQVTLTIDGKLGGSFSGGIVEAANSTLTLTLDLAVAEGRLTGVGCSGATPTDLTVDVTNKSMGSLGMRLNLKTLNLLGIPLATVTADVSTGAAVPANSHELPIPDAYSEPVQTGSGTLGLTLAQSDLTATTLGLPLSLLNVGSLTSNVLNPLTAGVNDFVVNSLAPSLGMTVAGADLFAVEAPACSTPIIVGP